MGNDDALPGGRKRRRTAWTPNSSAFPNGRARIPSRTERAAGGKLVVGHVAASAEAATSGSESRRGSLPGWADSGAGTGASFTTAPSVVVRIPTMRSGNRHEPKRPSAEAPERGETERLANGGPTRGGPAFVDTRRHAMAGSETESAKRGCRGPRDPADDDNRGVQPNRWETGITPRR